MPRRTFETGGLRWRFPRSKSPCEAVVVNTGGGVVGGDAYAIELSLDERAEAVITTSAAEKIYRADGEPARIASKLAIGPGASLLWLPQEAILFDGSRLERRLAVEMAPGATLLLVESLVFGRLAMGETRIDASFKDSWRIVREGRLVFADETRIENAGLALDRPAVGAGARATATIVAAAPNIDARLPELRAALAAEGESVEAGASAFDGIVVARLLSAAPGRLRAAVIAAIVALSGRKPPQLWQ